MSFKALWPKVSSVVLYLLCSVALALVVSWSGGSLSLLVTPLLGRWASSALVTPHQICRESQVSGMLVTPPLVFGRSPASGLLSGYNSRLWGESALSSAVGASFSSESELVGDSSSLLGGRGMDTLLSVLTWGLPWRQLKAALL